MANIKRNEIFLMDEWNKAIHDLLCCTSSHLRFLELKGHPVKYFSSSSTPFPVSLRKLRLFYAPHESIATASFIDSISARCVNLRELDIKILPAHKECLREIIERNPE